MDEHKPKYHYKKGRRTSANRSAHASVIGFAAFNLSDFEELLREEGLEIFVLKKADPVKYSTGSVVKDKLKERDVEMRRKSTTTKASVSSTAPSSTPGSVRKSSSTVARAAERLDLLDSILNQQSEFLQTMRRSEDRGSPEPVKVVPRVEPSEENLDHPHVDKGQDLTGAAEEAYRRFEQTFSESSSSKSSPKSPQFLSLLPPPPPPPKPVQQHANLPKKGVALSADMVHLLVPPPPPPPPQPPIKDVPPPPPPRRLKASVLEDLPPPPPPPKRLKPTRSSTVNKETMNKDASGLVEPKQEHPAESSKIDDLAVLADVKTCLEHVVFLVSSIKPFDEISGELLPDKEVPVPFSQRVERTAAPESNDGSPNCADASAEKRSVEKSSSSEEPQKDVPKEDEEEYDPLDDTVVEEFEAYVPSAVVARNVTLDVSDYLFPTSVALDSFRLFPFQELNSSFTSSPEQINSAEQEQYSPSSNMGLHIDEDDDEGEITEDSDSDIQSIADSDDDSECDDGVPDQNTFMRHDENGRLIKVVRHTRKRFDEVSSITSQLDDGVKKPLDNSTRNEADEEEVEMKPDREILDNPRHLLQRASAVLQGLGKEQGAQYTQMPYDDDYEEEECIQPMDSFHGEPVPDDDELFEVAAGIKPKRKEEVIVEERIPESTEKFEIDFYNGDLHLKGAPDNDWIIDPDNQDGLALVWGGVRKRPEWTFPNSLPSSQTERAPIPPESKSDCTVLMMVGLPSVGKTTWVRRYIREHPKEHWTLISADTILASMKVNKMWQFCSLIVWLLSLAARRRRNYILDFTNCDPDTRKKRLALFEGFFRQCVTIVPSDEVMQQRHAKHLPVMEMPVVSEFLEVVVLMFDPAMEDAQIAIDRIAKFNEEGRPWYSSKYNKRRGFWNGTYGDEPYRKPSGTQTRTQTVSSAEKNNTESNCRRRLSRTRSLMLHYRIVTRIRLSQRQFPTVRLVQISPVPSNVNSLPDKLAPISINGSENKAPVHGGVTLSVVSPVSRVNESQNTATRLPTVFNHPPPANPSLVVQTLPTPSTTMPSVTQPQ
ncbi:hypothetical protein OSTOST_09199, partial [Ostertagia ostertagi]